MNKLITKETLIYIYPANDKNKTENIGLKHPLKPDSLVTIKSGETYQEALVSINTPNIFSFDRFISCYITTDSPITGNFLIYSGNTLIGLGGDNVCKEVRKRLDWTKIENRGLFTSHKCKYNFYPEVTDQFNYGHDWLIFTITTCDPHEHSPTGYTNIGWETSDDDCMPSYSINRPLTKEEIDNILYQDLKNLETLCTWEIDEIFRQKEGFTVHSYNN